jgi:hypothetical protein
MSDWLARSDGRPETTRPKHPGDAPPKLDWARIHALTAWDLMANGPAPSFAAWKARIQEACQRAGITEPSEASLRPWLTVLGEMRRFGASDD